MAELANLQLVGAFRLSTIDGTRIEISSRKGQALIAMLAVAGSGERTRGWLQAMLWGSRQNEQARSSLRSELSKLRGLLKISDVPLLGSDQNRVWLDLSAIAVDLRRTDGRTTALSELRGDFLEGIDIAGEEAFEDWLRDERARTATLLAATHTTPSLPLAATANRDEPAQSFAMRPALAVLPFVNQTGAADQDILAEGISEDLIDLLSRLRWLPVVARSSSFALPEADRDPRRVGTALGVRYVLEGWLRQSAGPLMITASLADCESGEALWSARLSLSADRDGDATEALVCGLAATLGNRIDAEEQARALRKPQTDLNVRDLIWRGRWHRNRMTREDSRLARECFDAALLREPHSPEAIIQSTWSQLWDIWARRGSEAEIRALRQQAQNAIIADCDDARGHMLAGTAEIWLRQPLRAKALLTRAIALNPSLVMAHVQLGAALRVSDEVEAAITALNTAIRLSPNDHDMFFISGELAAAELMLGNHASALAHAEDSITRRASYWFAHVIKVIALARLGKLAQARAANADLYAAKPDFRPEHLEWQPFLDPRHHQFFKDGLNLVAL